MAESNYKSFGTKTLTDRTNPNKEQTAVVYDLISEGPIEGLKNDLGSVYLNDTPLVDPAAYEIIKPRRIQVRTTASSTTISQASGSNDFTTVGNLANDGVSGLNLGDRYIRIRGAAGTDSTCSTTANSSTITTTNSFFADSHISPSTYGELPIKVRISGAGPNGSTYVGILISRTSGTSAVVSPAVSTTVSNATITVDLVTKINSINTGSNTIVVDDAPNVSLTDVSAQISSPARIKEDLRDLTNFKNTGVAFRKGTRLQGAVTQIAGLGNSTFTINPNIEITQNDLYNNVSTSLGTTYNDDELQEPSQDQGTANDTIITSTGVGSLSLNMSDPQDTDEVKITFSFPQLYDLRNSSGAKGPGFVEFQIWFEYSRDGGSSYTSRLAFGPSNDEIVNRTGYIEGGRVNYKQDKAQKYPSNGYIRAKSFSKFIEEFIINTEQFQPFDRWRVRIRRINDVNYKDFSWQQFNQSYLQQVSATIKDKLSYPYAAYSALVFNAEDFEGRLPTRGYEIKGKLIKVPTNYFPAGSRDNDGVEVLVPSYKRNIISGVEESEYQKWDGNFRGDKTTFNETSENYNPVYCNNPVWVYYDLLTNTTYGLGKFIEEDLVDKYTLYRIAQYCDELVPDGEGGLEPRFTCNLYLQSAAEATKVLTDVTSIFRGMAFWIDGQMIATCDRPQEPIYTFTKGNVVGGSFSYTGTSEKFRTNQVRVTWNDPEDMYKQAVEVVEDSQNIFETDRIIATDIVAFGTTSRQQAHRLGKWRLLSDTLEKEAVSFVTSIAAGFLKPGDIINVQDSNRGSKIQFSGRVSNTGTISTTIIPLDREVTLASGIDYTLSLIFPKGGAYIDDDRAVSFTIGGLPQSLDALSGGSGYTDGDYENVSTSGGTGNDLTVDVTVSGGTVTSISINNTGYGYTDNDDITLVDSNGLIGSSAATFKINGVADYGSTLTDGDLVPFIITSEGASNLRDSSDVYIQNHWSENARVEQKPISTSAGTVSSLTVSTAFSSTPEREVIWAIKGTNAVGSAVDGSAKKYRVVSVKETEKHLFEIGATEYAEDKFDQIDRGYTLYNRPIVPTPQRIDSIPTPKNLAVSIEPFDPTSVGSQDTDVSFTTGNTVVVSWEAPTDSNNEIYKFLTGYELQHTFEGESFEKVKLGRSTTELVFKNTPAGGYIVRIRAENAAGAVSPFIERTIQVPETMFGPPVSKINELTFGGLLNESLTINTSTGLVEIGSATYNLGTTSGKNFNFSGTGTANYQQSFSGMGASATAYLLFDSSDTSDHLKALQIHTDTTVQSTAGSALNVQYWKQVGASNNGLTQITGTISVDQFSNRVTGSSTTFTSDFANGDLIRLDNGTASEATYARINYIDSDTLLYIEGVVARAYSGANADKQSFKPDFKQDCILAKITTDGSTVYSLNTIYATTAGIVGADGETGASVNIVFQRASSAPSTPSASAGVPSGWYDSPPSGTDLLWAVKGTKAVGASTFTWGTVFQVEGTAVAEIAIYRKASSVTTPTGGSYNFTTSTLTAPTSWSTSVPTLSANGDKIYLSVGLFTGSPEETAATTTWSTPVIYAQRTDGSSGTDARAVNLTIGDQTIEYDTNGANPSPSSTTVTATAFNTTGTVYYQFYKNGTSVQNTTTNTYTYSSPSSYTSMPEKIEVQIREGSSTSTVLATDQITISGLKAGANAITIVLSNDAHTLPTTSGGVVTYTGSGTDIEVWNGTTQVPYDGSSPYDSPSFRVSAAGSSITPGSASTVSTYIRRFADHSNMTANNAAITYTIIVKNEAGVENTFTRKQTFAKSIQGADGSIGADGKTVKLTPSSAVINYSTAGTESDTITFTTDVSGFTVPYYRFLVDGTESQASSTTSTFTLPDADEPAIGEVVNVKVEIKENNAGSVLATDTVSIYAVQDGSDAISGFLTNAAHTVQANSSGTVSSFSGAGGTYKVFVGGTDVTTSCTFSVSSETGVDVSINSTTGVYSVSSMSANQGTAIFQAVIPAATAGTASNVTITADYSISKSIEGAAGQDGDEGAGTTTIYYLQTGYTAPSTPSSGSSLPPTGWSTTVPTPAAGKSIWQSFGTKAVGGTSWTWAPPTIYIEFDYSFPGLFEIKFPTFDLSGTGLAAINLTNSDYANSSLTSGNITSGLGFTPLNDLASNIANLTTFKTNLALQNVTNESKATMFSSPTFTGTVSGVTSTHVGLGNVANERQIKVFRQTTTPTATQVGDIWVDTDDGNKTYVATATGTGSWQVVGAGTSTSNFTSGTLPAGRGGTGLTNFSDANYKNSNTTATDVGLGNVTNESKATMFSNPTFTGTVSGVTSTHVGLGNVTNNAQVRADLVGAPSGILNSNLSLSFASNTLTLSGGGGSAQTINKSTLGLNYTDGADITSQNTAAGIANQGSLATRNDVRAGTHIKNAAGSATLGDADIITSQGTAASISGQGSLATKSSVDFSTEVGGAQKPANNATNNGTTINTSGNVTGSMSVASGGSITIGNITIDGTNGRILITD